ncbi:hypothetical protein PG993_005223 [Apiospora rasikravindrae]|uniref:Uncharacterized protein n=1 Tax=Apiospora rasikravindrae TaxID=990691 RepID=A0ABR1THI3_9PEZI
MYSFKVLDSSNRPFMNKATRRGRGAYIVNIAFGQTKTQPGHNHNGRCVLFFPHKVDADAGKNILRDAEFGGLKVRVQEIRFARNYHVPPKDAAGPAPVPDPAPAPTPAAPARSSKTSPVEPVATQSNGPGELTLDKIKLEPGLEDFPAHH